MSLDPTESRIRLAAFDWLQQQMTVSSDVISRSTLQRGFAFGDERVSLMSPQGIFKPRQLSLPLSITTTFGGPYSDAFGTDGLLRYSYRGTDPNHADNVKLREAAISGVPLIYFHAILEGQYLPVWPVYVVGDDPTQLTFTVAVDDLAHARLSLQSSVGTVLAEPAGALRREYITRTVLYRLHQQAFRERVLHAYGDRCALCRLRHRELLDAAHIVPDSDPAGEPVTSNGIALCKLHHAAFDAFFIGIQPDYQVVVSPKVLSEKDGPMLQHGLQGVHGSQLIVPRQTRDRPDRELLEKRFIVFTERHRAA